jgi:hypothetical protein
MVNVMTEVNRRRRGIVGGSRGQRNNIRADEVTRVKMR